MSMQDKILDVLRRGGPQVSPKIAREVKGDGLIVSAYLSELNASGKLKISKMKIGTSPLYYLPGQEKRLTLFADRLNKKDKAVFDKLEQLKVLREVQLDLLGKVALRKMKDFAIPLQVTVGGKREIFWRWFLLDPEETNLIVSSLLQQVGPGTGVEEVTSANLSTPALTPNKVEIKSSTSKRIINDRVPTADELAKAAQAATTAASNLTSPNPSDQSESSTNNASTNNPTSSQSTATKDVEDVKLNLVSSYPPNTTIKGTAEVESVYPENTSNSSRGSVIFEDTIHSQVVEVINTADIASQVPTEINSEDELIVEQPTKDQVKEELVSPELTKAEQEEKLRDVEDLLEHSKVNVPQSKPEPVPVEEKIPEPVKEIKEESTPKSTPVPEDKVSKKVQKKIKKEVEVKAASSLVKEKKIVEEEPKVAQELAQEPASEIQSEPVSKVEPKEVTKEITEVKTVEPKVEVKPVEKQKSLVEKLKETFLPKRKGKAGELLPKVERFLTNQDIAIESSEVVRKNSDLSLQILVQTKVGKVLFFCKVRNKKRCDEKDISAAYMEAQVAKLPLLFLYTDEVSTKATDFLDSGSFDNLLLMKVNVEDQE